MAQTRQARSVPQKIKPIKRGRGSKVSGGASSARSSRTWHRVPGKAETHTTCSFDPITSKRQASALFARGAFGNYVRQWDSIEEIKKSGYDGRLVLRTRDVGGGGDARYDLTVDQAESIVKHGYAKLEDSIVGVGRHSFRPGIHYFNEQLNDQHKHVVIQGEICRYVRGLEFRYCKLNLPMRPAIEKYSRHAFGAKASWMLKQYCCPSGYDCIMDLLDAYPDHVIEFTVFDVKCGARKWNTIVWEVRGY